jgi:hypothetical protein
MTKHTTARLRSFQTSFVDIDNLGDAHMLVRNSAVFRNRTRLKPYIADAAVSAACTAAVEQGCISRLEQPPQQGGILRIASRSFTRVILTTPPDVARWTLERTS